MKSLSVMILAFMVGCVTAGPKKSEEIALAETPDFPDGKYVQDVTVDVPGHGNWQMRGVLRKSPTGMALVGLSPMGTTVFTIEDKYSDNNTKIEIFQPELKPHMDKILSFYSQLRPHLSGLKALSPADVPADWDVSFYASKKQPPLPPTIEVRSSRFSLRIEVDQYEP